MKKRILPALLALCMVMSLLPVAFAEGESEAPKCGICADENCKCEGCTAADLTTDPITPAKMCDACKAKAACNPCDLNGCTLVKGHGTEGCADTTKKHNYQNCAGKDNIAAGTCPAAAGAHTGDCPDLVACEYAGCSKDKGHSGAHNNETCKGDLTAASGDNSCGAAAGTHKEGCGKYAACDAEGVDGKKCTLCEDHTGPHNITSCTGDQRCNASVHTHKNGDDYDCPQRCTALDDKKPITDWDETSKTEGSAGDAPCTLSANHDGFHNNTVCVNVKNCGAGSHFPGIAAKPAEGQNAAVAEVAACPSAKATVCPKGNCSLPAGHTGLHNNTVCLGANDDGRCNTAAIGEDDDQNPIYVKHIAGCKQYVTCTCNHTDVAESALYTTYGDNSKELKYEAFTAGTDDDACSKKDGCAECARWNKYVTAQNKLYDAAVAQYKLDLAAWQVKKDNDDTPGDEPTAPKAPSEYGIVACTCVVCNPTPATPVSGVVEGGTVADPANPSETETPTKAEDFTDMEDWMAADVQVMLDNGWMNGMNNGKFEGREETTGEQVITVIARMLGADIKGGDEWRDSLTAWIEANPDLLEGIDLENLKYRKNVVLVLWRAAEKPDSDFELKFTDVDGLEGDSLTSMQWTAEKGIVKGNPDNTANPDGIVKRAELAAFAARYYALEK